MANRMNALNRRPVSRSSRCSTSRKAGSIVTISERNPSGMRASFHPCRFWKPSFLASIITNQTVGPVQTTLTTSGGSDFYQASGWAFGNEMPVLRHMALNVMQKMATKGLYEERSKEQVGMRPTCPGYWPCFEMRLPWMRMPFPLTGGSIKRELAGNTTSTDPRSQRIRESRKGRPCNELGLSAHCLSTACPHLRAPGAPRPRWAHHNAVL
jgi:hypothetical protein